MDVSAPEAVMTAEAGSSISNSISQQEGPSSGPTYAADDTSSSMMPAGSSMEVDGQDGELGEEEDDGGVIRCICGIEDDDGFTIQCEQCLVWQHCACMGMTSETSVPEVYYCEQCDPDPATRAKQIDVAFAQQLQMNRIENERRRVMAAEQYAKRKGSQQYPDNFDIGAGPMRDQGEMLEDPSGSSSGYNAAVSEAGGQNAPPYSSSAVRSRKPNVMLDLSNTGFVMPTVPASANATPHAASPAVTQAAGGPAQTPGATQKSGNKPRRTEGKERGGKGSRRSESAQGSAFNDRRDRGGQTPRSALPTPRGEDRLDGYDEPAHAQSSAQGAAIGAHIDASLLGEAWRVEFTPLTRNLISDRSVLQTLQNAMRPYENGDTAANRPSALRATQSASGKWIVPVKGVRQRSRLASGSGVHEDHDTPDPEEKGSKRQPDDYNTTSTSAHGLTAVGNECVPIELSAPADSLSELNLRTYVKQISDTAAAGIFTNVMQIVPLPSEPQRKASASRTFSRPVMHGLFAEQYMPAGSFICEIKGELGSADTYRADPRNMYDLAGCTKPHVHLFPPPLNIAIDARRFGTEARFARSSCHPNAVIRPILFRRMPAGEHAHADISAELQEPELLFGLFAIGDIGKMHEITVGWEWDDLHIVHLLPQLVHNPLLEDSPTELSNSLSKASAEARQMALLALAERGDFPYATTLFSAKMNAATTTLLGTTLCACIGSASAPGGSISASANNGKKQDCAVAQMLRVGQGMGLLNVQMPGKSSRKSKAPDFKPLVGVKRWWRPIVMPATPESSKSDPFDRSDARVAASDEKDEVKSDRTDPLSCVSDSESSDDEGKEDLTEEIVEKYVPSVLPPKKRISGTRIKATYSDNEEEDRHTADRAKLISAASAGASNTRGKRKAKRQELDFAIPEDLDHRRKKQRTGSGRIAGLKGKRITDRSSPLSPITSSSENEEDEEDEDSDSEGSSGSGDEERPISRGSDGAKASRHSRKSSQSIQQRSRKVSQAEKTRKMLLKLASEEGTSVSSEDSEGDDDDDDSSSEDTDEAEARSREEEERAQMKRRAVKKRAEAIAVKEAAKKKPKRVMQSSDSETSSDEEDDRSREMRDRTPSGIAISAADISHGATPAEALLEVKKEPTADPGPPAAPAEPEQPRAKMSLAEYRKRLMEKKTTTTADPVPKPAPESTPTAVPPSSGGLLTSRLSLPSIPARPSEAPSPSTSSVTTPVTPSIPLRQTPTPLSSTSAAPGGGYFRGAFSAGPPAPTLTPQVEAGKITPSPAASSTFPSSALPTLSALPSFAPRPLGPPAAPLSSTAASVAAAPGALVTTHVAPPTGPRSSMAPESAPSHRPMRSLSISNPAMPPPLPPSAVASQSPLLTTPVAQKAPMNAGSGANNPALTSPRAEVRRPPGAAPVPPPGFALTSPRMENAALSLESVVPAPSGPPAPPVFGRGSNAIAMRRDGGWGSRAARQPSYDANAAAGSMDVSPTKPMREMPMPSMQSGAGFQSAMSPPPGPSKTLLASPGGGLARPSASGFAPVSAGSERVGTNMPSFDPPKGPRALMASGGSRDGNPPAPGPAPKYGSSSNAVPLSGGNAAGAGGGGGGSSAMSRIPTGPKGLTRDEEGGMITAAAADGDRRQMEESPYGPPSGAPSHYPHNNNPGGGPPTHHAYRGGGRGGSGFQPPPRGSGWGGRARIRGGPRGRGGPGGAGGGGGAPRVWYH